MSDPVQPYVLYVDDDPQECLLMKAVAESLLGLPCVKVCQSVEQSQNFLTRAAAGLEPEFQPPLLLLLDYHLGVHSGLELLSWIQTQPNLNFPTAIYSNCDAEENVNQCYRAGAACFLRKPDSCKRMEALLRAINECIRKPVPDFACLSLIEEYRGPCAGPTRKPGAATRQAI